ncbi:unnamed protein product [Clonostachys byssicola]|uniref:Major facilitator superfamily (MFS) profile domain-containing protein n=1 Tax=Clonostachys byssicola TaxID=160290 RepID=A0A9N9XYI2_9HYPO|nr:unnamed protein product [Clonostachys byssicola]
MAQPTQPQREMSLAQRNSQNSLRQSSIEVESIRPAPADNMYRTTSRMSGPEALEAHAETEYDHPYREVGDEVYDRLSRKKKIVILAVMSFCAFLSPISSTSVLAATPEVAQEYNTTGSIINISNAGYMVFMGLSPVVWGPMSQVFGRRIITLITAIAFFLLSLGTALAPNIALFFVFRALSAFEGTAFILIGAACLGDIYRPIERGTAIGWFMSGTLFGPAFGPFLGGIIVTYSSWRTIFWLQTALAGVGFLGVFFLVPETIHHKRINDLKGYSRREKTKALLGMINPIRVLRWFKHLNLCLVAGASSTLVWNMYGLLTPIRYVLNPRFHLETPLLAGLFYLAPGVGYIVGTFMGGRWADWTVKRWIQKRGSRIAEDRLRSSLPFVGGLIPACILVYGWTVEKQAGGIAVPVVMMFIQGVGQLFCFPSLNTYCLDVMPDKSAEVTAANFFVRYLAGCLSTAVVLPIVQAIGVGWFSTISSGLLVLSAMGLIWAIHRGDEWAKKECRKGAESATTKSRVEGNERGTAKASSPKVACKQ